MVKLNKQLSILKKDMDVFEYMYVMDFSDATISEVKLMPEDENIESCDLLEKYGFNENTCSFMFTSSKINNITEIN